jgi:hypothetical protein
MKKIIFILCALSISFLPSCKKSNTGGGNATAGNGNGTGNNFSDSIRNIVPQPIIDSLRNWGMTIYDGQQPPTLSGSYLIVTDSCIFDNSGFMKAGKLFDEYQYTFSQEDLSRLTIRIDTKAINDPNGYTENDTDSTATFLAGTGNNFTIFAEEKGTVTSGYGISTYTELNIISGQISPGGIAHFEYSIYMKDKNDPANQLIPVNTSRIFLDGDVNGLARQTTTWSPLPFTVIGTKNSILQ